MKKFIVISFLHFCIFSLYVAGQMSFGENIKINDGWKFYQADTANAANLVFNDNNWRTLDLPHDWSIEGQLSPTLSSCTGFLPGGVGWYRKTINIPDDKTGKKVYLYFEGVYNRSEVYVNGHLLGKRPNGYISFMYDATPYIEFGKENLVAVRVDHSKSADSRWYTGSGIYRNVWLLYSNRVHLTQWGVFSFPVVSTIEKGLLQIETEVVNESDKDVTLTILNELYSTDGKKIAEKTLQISLPKSQHQKVTGQLKVNQPQLWSLENPYLYTLKTTLFEGKKVIDKTSTTTGFRSFTFDPDKGFALNGTWMKLKGVCLHHDAGVLGSAVPKKVWEERLKTLKSMGCNAIRTSHNPQSPDLYELCDKLGLLVMNEAFDEWEYPKRKWLVGWNIGTPGFEGSYDFFEEWSSRDIADMVRRDRNHISIFTWSIGNEVDYPNDPYSHPALDGSAISQPMFGGYKAENPDANRLGAIAKRLVADVKEYDTSRPVTAALAGVIMSNETEYPGSLDIAGYNYTEDQYGQDHKKYPNRIIYGSENRHDIEAWKAVTDNDYIFGQFLWTGIDYLGESSPWPARGFYSGLIDFAGNLKPRGYFREALWSSKPVIYIGTYPKPKKDYKSMDAWPIWNYNEGQQIRVVCYTNTPKAKLLLNGETIGETKDYDNSSAIISWDIPFKMGKLEVIGLNKEEKEICRYAIQSSSRPYALVISTDEETLNKDKGLALVKLQVVDENGIPVIISDDEITCTIEGPAKLLGLEAANNSDMSDYTDNTHRVYHGRILAYVQANGVEGTVKVSFSASWLKPASITLIVK